MPLTTSSALSRFRRYASSIHFETFNFFEILSKNWHLGFTAFGGPPVHFQILHKKFVEQENWIDEQLYQEIFALSQALPGPASTKMLFCINYIRGGLFAGITAFVLWCLPGAIGMFGLSLGVSKIGTTLPAPVYALLSGLNAATVGIIALAAVQLSQKAITDKLTRALVFLGGVAGILYTALWFFPVLMIAAGMVTVVWDFRWLHQLFASLPSITNTAGATGRSEGAEAIHQRRIQDERDIGIDQHQNEAAAAAEVVVRTVPSTIQLNLISWKTGLYIIASFLISFIAIILIRSVLKVPPRGASLFANLYLAGTIIFGGGPVVIPLLREYIVAPGWVSSRDFLLGLALIQSFPGPNFNFAVYLGSLAAAGTSLSPGVGALIGFLGIFTPGVIILVGVLGMWKTLRSRRWLSSLLRGVNAAAVGLVFTAVYKLFQIGFVDAAHQGGSPLGRDPWWVAITATSFVGGAWFGLAAPLAILLGGVMGMIWFAVTKT
ncbi:chromate transporter-domain-containing protein [Tricladium varicosporioides]|nr:chromate transporter-domain-containing protein [Hymenoscyphus varicosporioides]